MPRTFPRPCLEDEPCWRMRGATHKLAKGRAGVTVGINQLGKATKVKPAAEARRLAQWLTGKRLLTFNRWR